MTPLQVSIITPSFQSGEWLKLCIASVADQAGVAAEHIVRDGGSTDGTAQWLPTDPRVSAYIEKDAGMYDAINRGMRQASGEILAYLNCDEQYLPGTLARVVEYFAQHPEIDVVFGDAILVDEDGHALSYRRTLSPKLWHTRLDHLGTLSCAMFFRRAIFDEGFEFDIDCRMIGDAVFICSLLEAGKRMSALSEPLSIFTFTGSNLGQSAAGAMEEMRWRDGAGATGKVLRPLVVLQHRFRKLLAGAYRQRLVDYEIHTRTSPDRRVKQQARIGWHWPRLAAAG